MSDIEETLGHDLQIGCQRCRHTIDVDTDHHSTPLIAAGGFCALWSNRPCPWVFGHCSAQHDNQPKIIFGDNPSPSFAIRPKASFETRRTRVPASNSAAAAALGGQFG